MVLKRMEKKAGGVCTIEGIDKVALCTIWYRDVKCMSIHKED